MPDLYWRLTGLRRGELTDEAVVEFMRKVDDQVYQFGTVTVPKRATVGELQDFINARRLVLEAEAQPPVEGKPEIVEVQVPVELAGKGFDDAGVFKG